MADVTAFEKNLLTSGQVIEPEGIHSEFASGMHGQKIDFDKLDDKDPLYGDWIEVSVDYLRETFPRLPAFIIGVANGTNRVVHDMAKRMKGSVVALESEKDREDSKILHLHHSTARLIAAVRPEFVVVIEDVGTTGSNSVQVAQAALDAGAGDAVVVTTWKRRPQLERLEEAGIDHQAIIDNPLPTYTPEDCENLPEGFCAQGWELNLRNK